MLKYIRTRLFILVSLLGACFVFAQEVDDDTRNWDNKLYMANKVTWGLDRWKYSGEL